MDPAVRDRHMAKLKTCFFWPLTLDRAPVSRAPSKGPDAFLKNQFYRLTSGGRPCKWVDGTQLHLPKLLAPAWAVQTMRPRTAMANSFASTTSCSVLGSG